MLCWRQAGTCPPWPLLHLASCIVLKEALRDPAVIQVGMEKSDPGVGVQLPVLVAGTAGHAAHVGSRGQLLDDGVVTLAFLGQRQLLCDLTHAHQLP